MNAPSSSSFDTATTTVEAGAAVLLRRIAVDRGKEEDKKKHDNGIF